MVNSVTGILKSKSNKRLNEKTIIIKDISSPTKGDQTITIDKQIRILEAKHSTLKGLGSSGTDSISEEMNEYKNAINP